MDVKTYKVTLDKVDGKAISDHYGLYGTLRLGGNTHGGIVGYNKGNIQSCGFTGSIDTTAGCGGVAGMNPGYIVNSYGQFTGKTTDVFTNGITSKAWPNVFFSYYANNMGLSGAGSAASSLTNSSYLTNLNRPLKQWSMKSSVNNGVLKVYERIRGRVKINTTVKAGVTLTVPKGFEFDKITVSSGAGKIYIEKLSAKELSFDLGAGKVTVDEISVSDSATIEGGAGDFDVNSGSIKDLDFDIGVGNTEVTLTLSGDCELNMGIGNLELTLAGDKDGYTIDVNKGLGRVSIDGENMNDGDVYGNGNTDIEIDGGIGNIEVNFK
jgi:hypothetical protein